MNIMLIPFEIRLVKNPDKTSSLVAVVSIEDAIHEDNVKNMLADIQKKYIELVKHCKRQIREMKKKKTRGDSKIHWTLGDRLFSFLDQSNKMGFYFANAVSTLSRDIHVTGRYLYYHIQFREEYPSQDLVRDSVKWWGYQELLGISNKNNRKLCEEKLMKGDISTVAQLRKFKKSLR